MVITNTPVIKCDMISVTLTDGSTQTKIPFPDQPQLRGVFLQGLDFPNIAYDIYGKPTLNEDSVALTTSFITLYFEGRENVRQMPLTELVSNTNARAYNMNGALGFFNQQIIWPKCYITLGAPFPSAGQDLNYTFSVYYSTSKI